MGEVVNLPGPTRIDSPPEKILNAAQKQNLKSVVIIGWTEDDWYFASSIAAGPEVLWLLELARKKLMEVGAGDEG